jgi:alpha-amylase
MGVMMQTFYWDCPGAEGRDGQWWPWIEQHVESLARTGFTALWLPPACKAANIFGPSMGYDPYDYYDLGSLDQKGRTSTWFGSEDDLRALIAKAHDNGLQVYADFVFNHNNGADATAVNPIDGQTRWTEFHPQSGRFPRTWESFHPCRYEQWDNATFGGMPDLCHRNPIVYTELLRYAQWLLESVGFDGFRYDMVKGYGAWIIRAIQELRALHGTNVFKLFGVGEDWDGGRAIVEWLTEANAWSDNPVSAFDFPLRYILRDICNGVGVSLERLLDSGTVLAADPARAVTFVENHDVERNDPVVTDKMMAYAFILTSEGYPCVYWRDYFNYGLADEGKPSGIAALVRAHEDHAGGSTAVLHVDPDLYIAQRNGAGAQQGLFLVLNNRGEWNGTSVQTRWPNRTLRPVAWRGRGDLGTPDAKTTDGQGSTDLWAPPRGYVVYVP